MWLSLMFIHCNNCRKFYIICFGFHLYASHFIYIYLNHSRLQIFRRTLVTSAFLLLGENLLGLINCFFSTHRRVFTSIEVKIGNHQLQGFTQCYKGFFPLRTMLSCVLNVHTFKKNYVTCANTTKYIAL